MIIESDYLREGLFGQIFVWMLEILPYVNEKQWKPEWCVRSKNFGQPPTFNIFPKIIQQVYTADESDEKHSLESLQQKHKFNFKNEFKQANKYWETHFRFSPDVYDRLNKFWASNFENKTVLGLHYRGTDKNVDLGRLTLRLDFNFSAPWKTL